MSDKAKEVRGEGDDDGDVAAGADTQGETASATPVRGVYSVALLIMRGREWTLQAQAFVAESYDEARELGISWAKQTYPGADSYHAQACSLFDLGVINELAATTGLAKEIEELRRRIDGEPETVSIFSPPESDKAH